MICANGAQLNVLLHSLVTDEDQVGLTITSSSKVDSNCTMLSNCVMTLCLPGCACIVSGARIYNFKQQLLL